MIVFVTFSVFLMNLSLSEFSYQEYLNNFIKECGLYDGYIYVDTPSKEGLKTMEGDRIISDRNSDAMAYAVNRLKEMQDEGIIETMFTTDHFYNHTGEIEETMIYPPELVLNLKFPTTRGRWFSESDLKSEYTPIVLGYNYLRKHKIGDIITIEHSEIVDKEDGSYEIVEYSENCVVIGFLKQGALILITGAGGTDMGADQVFCRSDDTAIMASENLGSRHHSYVIKVAAENRQRVIDEIFDIAPCFTFERMANNTYEGNKQLTAMQSTVFFLMMLVCIAGVSSGNLLATIACKKKYAVYFMCGMNWRTGVFITLSESVLKLVIPAAAGYVMFEKWVIDHDYFAQRITAVNPILTTVFLLAVFLLTSLVPLIDIKRTSPVKIIVDT